MNEKKMFPEKKLFKKSLLGYFEKKGFYIVLILCVAIIAATAVFLSTTKVSSPNSDNNAKIVPEAVENPITAVDKAQPAQSSINSEENTPVNKVTANEPTVKAQATKEGETAKEGETVKGADKTPKSVPAPTKNPAKQTTEKEIQKFAMPVFGDISFNYSEDKLIYSKTLEEWRTHNGIDLTAERGTAVVAVADGVVSEIKNDPRFGITVIIDHQNGLKTVYANLASDEMVTPNQKIKQGDVIGAIGSSATIEAAEQAHLHFEVWKQDKVVNPEEYLTVK